MISGKEKEREREKIRQNYDDLFDRGHYDVVQLRVAVGQRVG